MKSLLTVYDIYGSEKDLQIRESFFKQYLGLLNLNMLYDVLENVHLVLSVKLIKFLEITTILTEVLLLEQGNLLFITLHLINFWSKILLEIDN